MKILENYPLSNLNTFRTGGNARFFCIVKNVGNLKKANDFAKNNKVNFFVLGGGSNVLISDNGFNGLVIRNEILGKKILPNNIVCFGAGENWDKCVQFAIKNKLFGLENLSYIPGTVGGAAVQNIGAYGVEAKDFIYKVEVFDVKDGKVFVMKGRDCKFSYRNSIFKQKKNLIVTKVYFVLDKKFTANLNYGGIKVASSTTRRRGGKVKITAMDVRKAVISIRKSKLPEISELGSAVSFFKNPIVGKKKFEKIQNKYQDIKFFEEKGKIKISLGFVLDKICGLRGYRKNNVGFYDKQPLVIVNYGKATTKEILALAEIAERKVKEKIGIKIEMEVEKK